VGEIKIDRSFVAQISAVPEDATIVRTIVDLAHGLGLRAVAEGVETREVWDVLDGLGCDAAQGWYISRPMTAEAMTTWLTRHPSRRAVRAAWQAASDLGVAP
jgi:EAL domain-containing protein (putative c-di-GMP-specific phosphodiesterase class I)